MAKHRKTGSIALTAIAMILGITLVALAINQYFSAEGYVEVNVLDVIDNNIYVGNNCTAIVAETSPERAESIQLGLEKRIDTRPNSHDLFAETLKEFNITLEQVTIDSFNGHWYLSSMYMRSGDKVLKLDSKPTDAIAVALRTDSKMYVNATLLKERGENVCQGE